MNKIFIILIYFLGALNLQTQNFTEKDSSIIYMDSRLRGNDNKKGISFDKDSISTQEILITANRIKMSTLLAPNKIQVFNDNYISKLNGDKLSDLLNFADATFIEDYGFNSGLKTISLNSTQSEHALVLLNGIMLNSPENAEFDAILLQLNDINKIEISNSGSSALYGSEAIGGVINIITNENPVDKPFSFKASDMIGSFGCNKYYLSEGDAVILNGTRLLDYNLSYSSENARNDYDYNYFNGFSNVLKNRANNDFRSNNINFDANYNIDNSASLKLFTLYTDFNRGVPGTDFGFTASQARQIDNDIVSSLGYEKMFSDNIGSKTNLDYKYSLMKYYDPSTFNSSTPINDFYKINSFINSSDFNFFQGSKHEITTGYDLSYDNLLSDEVEKSRQTQAGIYAAGKYEADEILDKITIYPSLRYDYFSDINASTVTGKLGINLKPFKRLNLTLKSSVSNNFRAPTFNELFWLGLGNKNLKPEKSTNFDGGFYFDFSIPPLWGGKVGLNNRLEATYFNINTTDRIVWTPDNNGIWRPINIEKVNSQGIDLSLKSNINILKSISCGLSINYNYATSIKKDEDFPGDLTYDKQLIDIPQEYTKTSLFLDYSPRSAFLKLISVNIFYTFIGKRFIDLENTSFIPYYDLFNGNIDVDLALFNTITSLKFVINNIANKDYEVLSGYPMPLRNYQFQIGIKY